MTDPFFFGYGSLVNRGTHAYSEAYPAVLRGWRRAWRGTTMREVAFLTAEPDPASEIAGLVAHVPGGDWAALDEREFAYARNPVTEAVRHQVPRACEIQVYAVPKANYVSSAEKGIYLSYLDVVVQGYLTEFGEAGVQAFFASTVGWDAPIWNDRAAPLYPRHQVLAAEETALCDAHIKSIGAQIVPLPSEGLLLRDQPF